MNEESGGDKPPNISNDSSVNKNIEKYNLENRYQKTDSGLYFVILEHRDKNVGRLFPIKVGFFLQQVELFKTNIVDIKSVGLNRVKVVFKNYQSANSLINHEIIVKNNLIAYIPTYYTHKKGVIRMVDTFFKDEYLKQAIVSDVKVTEVKRMKRKVVDQSTKETKLVDRQMVVVTFLGNHLPQSVKINMVNFLVEPYYYPVVQCFKCLRFGHTISQCKGKDRCKNCGQEDCTNPCIKEVTFCVNCGNNNHISLSRQCPFYKKQQDIKKVMAIENTSFKEAEFIVNNPSYAKITTNNRFSLLNNIDNFPELPKPKSDSVTFNLKKPRNNTPVMSNNLGNSTSKKRKASSPPPTPSPTCSQQIPKNTCILPNPYREEFKQYKENMIFQMCNLINNILNNQQNINENTIREQIALILENPNTSANHTMETISIEDDDCSEY